MQKFDILLKESVIHNQKTNVGVIFLVMFEMLQQVVIMIKLSYDQQSIGAVNTIVRRRDDGKLVGYNTDCEAAIVAIEDTLKVP